MFASGRSFYEICQLPVVYSNYIIETHDNCGNFFIQSH